MKCTCMGLEQAIKEGVKRMQDQESPQCLIEDFIEDMLYGDWINCTCGAGMDNLRKELQTLKKEGNSGTIRCYKR